MARDWQERLYRRITGESGELSCKGLEDRACGLVPRNFVTHAAALVMTKTGDALSRPSLILTWLLGSVGAPASVIGLLAPVRESGSLLPQIPVSRMLEGRDQARGIWITGCTLQGLAVLGMAATTAILTGAVAGWTILALLAVFSLARGLCSISSKVLTGKLIPQARRGRLSGLASSIAGWSAVGVGIYFALQSQEEIPTGVFAILLLIAGLLWLGAAAWSSRLVEFAKETPDSRSSWSSVISDSWGVLQDDDAFRQFCIARALLASTVLSMPFYVVLAQEATRGAAIALGLLVVASNVATAASAFVWGRLADHSSRLTMAVAGLAAGGVGCVTVLTAGWEFSPTVAIGLWVVLFFAIGLAHTGIRQGRKTYLVDMAPDDQRARYVAMSNTLMGVVLVASSGFGLLADTLGPRPVILVFALLGLAGGGMALRLREAV